MTRVWIAKGKPKTNFEPGYDLRAKVTVLAEGPRGSLAKQLIERMKLDQESNPQTYAVGIKELWGSSRRAHRAGHCHPHGGLAADLGAVWRRLAVRSA